MTRFSLLTNGLDSLAAVSHTLSRMLKELYELDDVLQDAHQEAKRDDENGERVVTAYERFLKHRESIIEQLQKEKVAVPWQLRVRIDDIELTLRQRKEKREAAQQATDKEAFEIGSSDTTSSTSAPSATTEAPAAEEQDAEKKDPLLMLKAMILPSVFIALLAVAVYLIAK